MLHENESQTTLLCNRKTNLIFLNNKQKKNKKTKIFDYNFFLFNFRKSISKIKNFYFQNDKQLCVITLACFLILMSFVVKKYLLQISN